MLMLFPWLPEKNWVPVKLVLQDGHLLCRWLYAGEKGFTEPFFSDTVARCSLYEENMNRTGHRTPLESVLDLSSQADSIPPSLFIFHISRCGSTLVSQLLGLEPSHIVLSEVPFLDELLRMPYNKKYAGSNRDIDSYFKAALKLYGRHRNGREEKLFIKTESWHLFFYRQLRQMYPSVPFIILYRSPGEVIRSQQKRRGMHAVPGVLEADLPGLRELEATTDFDLYTARVLEQYFKVILEVAAKDPLCRLVSYHAGIHSIMQEVFSGTGIDPSPEYISRMQERSRFHSKSPGETYVPEPLLDETPEWQQPVYDMFRRVEEVVYSL